MVLPSQITNGQFCTAWYMGLQKLIHNEDFFLPIVAEIGTHSLDHLDPSLQKLVCLIWEECSHPLQKTEFRGVWQGLFSPWFFAYFARIRRGAGGIINTYQYEQLKMGQVENFCPESGPQRQGRDPPHSAPF